MRKKTTNDNVVTMTPDEMKREVARKLAAAKKRVDAAIARFLGTAKTNPAYAVAQWAGRAIRAQTDFNFWRQFERELAKHGPATALSKATEECRDGFRTFMGCRSESLLIASAGLARSEALQKLGKQATRLMSPGKRWQSPQVVARIDVT